MSAKEALVGTDVRLRFDRKIDKLNSLLLSLGTRVEENVHMAVRALERRDASLANKVVERDFDIDVAEVDLEEECLEVLALHQPVAVDLRHIIAIIKINKDLERAGDHAMNIARAAMHLSSGIWLPIPADYFRMAAMTESMLKKSLDAFVGASAEKAYEVLTEDDEVDKLRRSLHRDFEDRLREEVDLVKPLVRVFLVSRNLERIADLATNIAEEVIYMVTGEIVRHGRKIALQREKRQASAVRPPETALDPHKTLPTT